MKPSRFIEIMEECYAPYPGPLKDLIGRWLEKKSPDYVGILSRVMLETHSTKFKTPPGIADFAEAHSAILDEQQAQAMRIAGSAPLMIESDTEKPLPAELALEMIGRILDNLGRGIDSRKDQELTAMMDQAEKEYGK
jgi:hypothetical protein